MARNGREVSLSRGYDDYEGYLYELDEQFHRSMAGMQRLASVYGFSLQMQTQYLSLARMFVESQPAGEWQEHHKTVALQHVDALNEDFQRLVENTTQGMLHTHTPPPPPERPAWDVGNSYAALPERVEPYGETFGDKVKRFLFDQEPWRASHPGYRPRPKKNPQQKSLARRIWEFGEEDLR